MVRMPLSNGQQCSTSNQTNIIYSSCPNKSQRETSREFKPDQTILKL